jgi:hypothetical protein
MIATLVECLRSNGFLIQEEGGMLGAVCGMATFERSTRPSR